MWTTEKPTKARRSWYAGGRWSLRDGGEQRRAEWRTLPTGPHRGVRKGRAREKGQAVHRVGHHRSPAAAATVAFCRWGYPGNKQHPRASPDSMVTPNTMPRREKREAGGGEGGRAGEEGAESRSARARRTPEAPGHWTWLMGVTEAAPPLPSPPLPFFLCTRLVAP